MVVVGARAVRRLRFLAFGIVAVSGCAPTASGSDARPAEGAVVGQLTAEGVECQAMRGSDGQLYTLVGDLGDFKAGDRVCVFGERPQMSTCMQGITIRVSRIARASECGSR